MFELKDKVIVLTGATGVLGSELALSLAKANAKLVILGRNEVLLDELKKKLVHLTYVEYHVVNVLDRHELEKVRTSIIQTLGQIDSLINAVGGNLPGAVIPDDKNIFDLSETDFDEVVEMNLKGTILPSIVFGEIIANQGKGSIVNYSSMTVDRVMTRVVGYSAAKAAMENFTRWMAVEMALKFGEGIRVNAIAPGYIRTEMTTLPKENEHWYPTWNELTPMNRMAETHEVASAALFLCSPASSYVTGEVLVVDGGYTTR